MNHRRQKLLNHGIKVRFCTCPGTDYHGFTLQGNHIFGEDEHGYFVVQRMGDGCVYIYRLEPIYIDGTNTGTEWKVRKIGLNTDTARQIFALRAKMPSTKLYRKSVAAQVREVYHPRIVTGCNYTPMGHMRIPMGAWKTNGSYQADGVKKPSYTVPVKEKARI